MIFYFKFIFSVYLETVEHEYSDKKNRLVYTHKLLPGINPVEGYGLRLAESLDVSDSVLDIARMFAAQIQNSTKVRINS